MEEHNYIFKYKISNYGKVKNSTFFNSSLSCPNTQDNNISQVIVNNHLYIFFALASFLDSNIEFFKFAFKTSIYAFNVATSSYKSASLTKPYNIFLRQVFSVFKSSTIFIKALFSFTNNSLSFANFLLPFLNSIITALARSSSIGLSCQKKTYNA